MAIKTEDKVQVVSITSDGRRFTNYSNATKHERRLEYAKKLGTLEQVVVVIPGEVIKYYHVHDVEELLILYYGTSFDYRLSEDEVYSRHYHTLPTWFKVLRGGYRKLEPIGTSIDYLRSEIRRCNVNMDDAKRSLKRAKPHLKLLEDIINK